MATLSSHEMDHAAGKIQGDCARCITLELAGSDKHELLAIFLKP